MKIKSQKLSEIVVSIPAPPYPLCPCPTLPPPQQWGLILLPPIVGLLHLCAFYNAVFGCILFGRDHDDHCHDGRGTTVYIEEFCCWCFLLDSPIFMAYPFDLICCLFFGVIPFSRCNCSHNIVVHHLPTLILALPLAVPLWNYSAQLRALVPLPSSLLNLDPYLNGVALRANFMAMYMVASGYAYASLMNEVLMCAQHGDEPRGHIIAP
jgi:hypothetical protein